MDQDQKFGRDSMEFKLVMTSSRHLSKHRMANVANKLTRGCDWRGSPKGRIALGLLNGTHGFKAVDVNSVCYALQTAVCANGHMAISDWSRQRASEEFDELGEGIHEPAPWKAERRGRLARGLSEYWGGM